MTNKVVKFIGQKPPNAGRGRPKGSRNKTTVVLRDAVLQAAEQAGGKGGLVAYLARQAVENPQLFIPLLGKILPMPTVPSESPLKDDTRPYKIPGLAKFRRRVDATSSDHN